LKEFLKMRRLTRDCVLSGRFLFDSVADIGSAVMSDCTRTYTLALNRIVHHFAFRLRTLEQELYSTIHNSAPSPHSHKSVHE
jgi:hypothetical protein